jgi:putrescine transport system permease protein
MPLARRLVAGLPFAWLLVFFLVPFLIVLKISFAQIALAMPPYTPLLEWAEGRFVGIQASLANYSFLFTDPLYVSAYAYSVKVAAVSTALCLAIGYPMALSIARSGGTARNVLLMLVILPFWTSFLLRVYAWMGLLKTDGVINNVLGWFAGLVGVPFEPLVMMNTSFAVYVGIVYSYLPFMILPLYANLEKHDRVLLEAAADLGARPMQAFLRVTLPLSVPGIVAGCLLVFIPAVGEYVIPSLLGSTSQLMIGRVLSDFFFQNRDWPVASAVAVLMLLLLVLPIALFQRYEQRAAEGRP